MDSHLPYQVELVKIADRLAAQAGDASETAYLEVLAGPDAAALLATDGRFTAAEAGDRELKGFASPVPAWRIQSAGVG